MMTPTNKALREFVHLVVENKHANYDPDLVDIVNLWINDPRNLDDQAHDILKQFVAAQTISQPTRLERIVEPGTL